MICGFIGFVLVFLRAAELPDFTAEFPSGHEATFTVTEVDQLGRAWQLYSDDPDLTTSDLDCDIQGPDTEASVGSTAVDHQGESGGEYWQLVAAISVSEPGEYTISCGTQADGRRYAVAFGEDGMATASKPVFVFLSGGAPVLLGLLLGGTIWLVTLTRRRRHRARLLSQRMGPPPHHH